MRAVDAVGPERLRAITRSVVKRRRMKRARHEGREAVRRFKKYRDDPVGFAREVLGVTAWTRQSELLEAAALHDRVCTRSGHKVGKSLACVVLALWWVCTRARGRVILTAPTFHQVKDILWRELRAWYPKVKGALGGPDLPKDPGTGLDLPGGRQIVGISVSQPENLAGISGPELLFIVDEGSGFPDELFEVIRGNSAGGSKIIAMGNPTRTVGWFFEAFRVGKSGGTYDLRPANDNGVPRHRWRLLHISSEEAARYQAANDNGVPGLATAQWIDEMRDHCGPDHEESAEYLVRVRGDFPSEATDAVIGFRLVREAQERWDPEVPAYGELALGVDVARFGDDETIIQPVRGTFSWEPTAVTGDGNEVADEVVRVALSLRQKPLERVRVNVDGIGVGASVVDALRRHTEVQAGRIYVVDVNVGEKADAEEDYVNLRSQVWFGLRDWLRDGGALPPDEQLTSELLAPTYTFDSRNRKKVMRKEDIRKLLKRSPDRADALGLAVYRGRRTEYGYEAVRDKRKVDDRGGWQSARAGRRGAL
jgi:phage terminase large subunit